MRKEQEFFNIVKHLDNSLFSKYDIMFCEFYLNSPDSIRLKLFKHFPELINKIIKLNQEVNK